LNRSSQHNRHLVGRLVLTAVAAAVLCAAAPAVARTGSSLPEGFSAGPLILSPYIATSMGYDDNLFRSNANPQAETFTLTSLGVSARLPVRNSWLDLNYQVDKRDYAGYQPNRPREQTFAGAFQFNFGSGDTIIISDTYQLGASDVTTIDQGGELVFRDAPFSFNRAEVVWQRTSPSLAGFTIRVARVDATFDILPNRLVPFFDYNGLETSVEYRHPIPGRRWLRGYFASRRFEHYDQYVTPDNTVDRAFRREEHSDTLQVGMAGVFGRGHSFEFRVGYGQFRLVGDGAEFRGVVGRANVTLLVGGRTRVSASLWRRPLPSNFDTYYIVNSVRVSAQRNVARNVVGGVGLEAWRNGYLDPVPTNVLVDVGGIPQVATVFQDREDQRLLLEGYLEWFPHPRVGIRLAAAHQDRNSNIPQSEFSTTGASLGLRLGWF